ncbi:hypothetical protein ACQEVZ_37165 [Dactylosporangium sp. CA-152071]
MYLATIDVTTIKIWLRDLTTRDPRDTALVAERLATGVTQA